MPTIADKLTALFAKSTTPVLIESLLTLEVQPPSPERNWARAKTIEELERRFPQASAAVEAAFDADEVLLEAGEDSPGVDYVAVLLAAIPEDQRNA